MTTPAVRLRALEPADLPRCHAWHNSPELYATLGAPFRFVSSAAEEAWLADRVRYSTTQVSLAICVGADDTHVGNVYLTDIDWISRTCVLSIFIGEPSQRGQGHGRAALDQALAHAVGDLNLRKVRLEVLAGNDAAIALYRRVGFETEGTLRQQVWKQGAWRDVLVMAWFAPAP